MKASDGNGRMQFGKTPHALETNYIMYFEN